jgi:antirestriction protein
VELNRASQLIKDKFPDIGVRCFFVNFEGVFAACGEGAEQAA